MAISFSFNDPMPNPAPAQSPAIGTSPQEVVVEGSRDASDVLRLAVAQMHCAITEGQPQVQVLSNAITLMHEALAQLRMLPQQADPAAGTLASHEVIASQLAQAVLAIQFYDRLTQRLGHVRHSLELLEHTLSGQDHSTQHWHQTLDAIRATYTMEDEKRVFEIVMKGGTAEDVANSAPPPPAAMDDSSIELF